MFQVKRAPFARNDLTFPTLLTIIPAVFTLGLFSSCREAHTALTPQSLQCAPLVDCDQFSRVKFLLCSRDKFSLIILHTARFG